jgi:hypothetical protein
LVDNSPDALIPETMSSYLIRRIEENPKITFHLCTEIVRLSGDEQLARVTLRNNLTDTFVPVMLHALLAAAVGGGSIAISLAHQVLRE